MCDQNISPALLDWYDAHARDLPWRILPAAHAAGLRPDPYRIWLSEIMLQQTTVAAVKEYFLKFTRNWPDVAALAAADDADVMAAWAGLGYYARARNLLKCARQITTEFGGQFPETKEALLTLPGIGPYTASAIAAIAFDLPETVVDGNVERVMARLHDVQTPLPPAKAELTQLATRHTPTQRPGDYAQAVMDLGATICTPRKPACALCPISAHCLSFQKGDPGSLPRKLPKKIKPTRRGIAYIVRRRDGAWLLETRPPKGLLGGMLGWPCSDWSDAPQHAPPIDTEWETSAAEARHTFTHFHLRLEVKMAVVGHEAIPDRGRFVAARDFDVASLPTLMRKAHNIANATLCSL